MKAKKDTLNPSQRKNETGFNKDSAEKKTDKRPDNKTQKSAAKNTGLIKHKQGKITITVLLSLLNAYVLYALAACYFVWLKQPRFLLENGDKSSSLGFLIQFIIYFAVFLITVTALIITSVKFYKKKKSA